MSSHPNSEIPSLGLANPASHKWGYSNTIKDSTHSSTPSVSNSNHSSGSFFTNPSNTDAIQEAKVPQQRLFDINTVIKAVEKQLKREMFFKEISLYIIFVTVLIGIVFLQRNVEASYEIRFALEDLLLDEEFNSTSSHILKNYSSIKSKKEFWQWIDGPLTSALQSTQISTDQPRWLYNVNKIVGAMRIRQIRISPKSCPIPKRYSKMFNDCYWWYYFWNKDTKPFGPENDPERWKYTSAEENHAPTELGKLAVSYGGSGYVVNVPINENLTQELAYLQANNFLDMQTRAIFISLNIYNPNLNHFGHIDMICEFGPGGSIFSWSQWRIFRIDMYSTPTDIFRAFLESIFALILIYYFYREAKLWRKHSKDPTIAYFSDPWNWLEIINLIIFAVVTFQYVSFLLNDERLDLIDNPQKLDSVDQYIPIDNLAKTYLNLFSLNSFNILLVFIKIFKYLQLNDRMQILWTTLGRSATDLAIFLFFFSIVFIGYSIFGHVLFGPDTSQFKTFLGALSTCFQMAVGYFEYGPIEQSNRVLAPLFFITFVILVYFTLANMFLAIINDTYLKLQASARGGQILKQKKQNILVRFLTRIGQKLFSKKKKKRKKFTDSSSDEEETDSDPDVVSLQPRSSFAPASLGLFSKNSHMTTEELLSALISARKLSSKIDNDTDDSSPSTSSGTTFQTLSRGFSLSTTSIKTSTNNSFSRMTFEELRTLLGPTLSPYDASRLEAIVDTEIESNSNGSTADSAKSQLKDDTHQLKISSTLEVFDSKLADHRSAVILSLEDEIQELQKVQESQTKLIQDLFVVLDNFSAQSLKSPNISSHRLSSTGASKIVKS